MSILTRLLKNALPANDEDAQPTSLHPPPAPRGKVDNKVINDFVALSTDTSAVEINARLALFQQCNATIAGAAVDAIPTKRKADINGAAGVILTSTLASTSTTASSDNAFVHLVQVEPDQFREEPDEKTIFDEILKAGTVKVLHPAGLSTLAFAFASLIHLCKSYPSPANTSLNQTSGFLDLYPLYGATDADAKDTVRVYEPLEIGWGLILPDVFFEDGERLEFLPQATSALVLLFARNHNSLARRILAENQQGKWAVDPTTLAEDSPERQKQDDEIFELAKRVNCATFRSIVKNDFLKGLLGLPLVGEGAVIDLFAGGGAVSDKTSVEFSLLFGWLATMADLESAYVVGQLQQIGDPETVTKDALHSFYQGYTSIANMDKATRPCIGLNRDDTNAFPSSALASILRQATETSAHAFKPRGTARTLRVFEESNIGQGREWDVCGFNEFRKALGLVPYKSFQEWSGDASVAAAAQKLYGDIEGLELYVGLRGEKTLQGPGFQLGETMTYGLISEIVRVIRADPNAREDAKLATVTKLGAEELKPSVDNGASGAVLPNVILNNFPGDYSYNSALALFPFVTPNKTKELLATTREEYDFSSGSTTTTEQTTHTIDGDASESAVKQVLNESDKFKSPYGDALKGVTGGYGYLLGFDDAKAHDQDEYLTLTALIPDKNKLDQYAVFYKKTTEKAVDAHSTAPPAGSGKDPKDGERKEVDLQDVINDVAASFAAEKLLGITLTPPGGKGKGITAKELFAGLKDINDTIFDKAPSRDKFATRRRALQASAVITKIVEKNIKKAIKGVGAEDEKKSFLQQIIEFIKEFILEEEDTPGSNGAGAEDFHLRLGKSGRNVKELSANALGLAVLSTVSFAETLSSAVNFYLDDARSAERATLIGLSKQATSADGNKLIMGYIREAQRLNPQHSPIHRLADIDTTLDLGNGVTAVIKKGDKLLVDLKASLTGSDTTDSKIIDPKRDFTKVKNAVHGAGFHKCIGIPFVEKTMPEAFKAIFRLQDLKPKQGLAKTLAKKLLVQYIRSTIPKRSKRVKSLKDLKRPGSIAQRIFDIFLFFGAVYLFYWIALALGGAASSAFSSIFGLAPRCSNPTHLRSWDTYTILPGPDNRALPFILTLEDNPKPRKLTFVDIDQKDVRFNVGIFVDGKKKPFKKVVSSDFVVDKNVDCGDDAEKCLKEGFSTASVVVPKSKGPQVVKVEWKGKEVGKGSNVVDWGLERSRRIMWKQETCA